MRIQFLVGIILLATEIAGKLDFSQFYLPPCCYTSPQDHFSGYALPSKRVSVTSKRDAFMQRVTLIEPSQPVASNVTLNAVKATKGKLRLYSLIVPIRDVISKKQQEVLTLKKQLPSISKTQSRKTIGKVLVPRSEDSRRNSNQEPVNSLLENIFTNELEHDNEERRILHKKSTGNDNNTEDETESRMEMNYEPWDPQKITGISTQIEPSYQNLHNAASENANTQFVKKLPSSWAKYLRRALYQSITEGQGITSTSNVHTQNQSRSKIRFPDTWKSIKNAPLQYVDKMSQVSTIPRASLYLPPAEGPIVSGVLVNSHDGNLHLRVAAELYYHGVEENCRCYLINPGEILLAYWSVSRIFKANGQPALQYLVHPLPHSVPTPPDFRPFSNAEMFLPSPIDPLTTIIYQDTINPPNHLEELHQQNSGHLLGVRNPKLVQENSNNHHHLGQQSNVQQQNTINHQHGSNLILENGNQYPPEFLKQYQQAVQNFFNQNNKPHAQQAGPDHNPIYQTIPYSDLNMNYPTNYDLPIHLAQLMLLPPVLSVENAIPSIEPANVGIYQNPTKLPANDVQLSKPPTSFPTSIQDIISPEVHHGGAESPRIQQQVPLPMPPAMQHLQQPGFNQFLPIQQQGQFQIPPEQQLQQQGLFPFPEVQQEEGPLPFPISPPPMQHPFLLNYPNAYYPQQFHLNLHNQGIRRGNNLDKTTGNFNAQKENNNTKIENTSNDERNSSGDDQHDKPENHKPHTVSNILDNEKKYYPIRQPQKLKYSEKYYFARARLHYKNRLAQDVNSKGGYILDF